MVQPAPLGPEPLPPRLMLATSILPALRVTQSTPQIMLDHEPEPEASSTRTAHSRAPGATPTTPMPLSRAAAIPATWVPCPWPSFSCCHCSDPTDHVEVRMAGVDTGVDDRDVDVEVARAITRHRAGPLTVDPVDASGQRLGSQVDLPVKPPRPPAGRPKGADGRR